MPLVFKRTDDEDYPRHLKVLVQGPPKAGKTTFVSTAPNVLIAALPDAGLASIAHLGIPYIDVNDTDTLQQLEMVLRDDTLRAKAAHKVGLPSIDTVVIDTLDNWQDMLKKEILAENRRTQMQQADWGVLKERMAAVLKKYVTLPINVIFTVHTSTTQDEESRLIYMPALQGGIKDEVAGYVDYSLLAFRQRETGTDGVTKVNYYLKAEGDQKNPTIGNRGAGRIPEIIANPDFKRLHEMHFGAIKKRQIEHRARNEVIKGDETPDTVVNVVMSGASAAPPAQSPSTPERTVEVPAASTGVPEDDPNGPINASGVTMLTKSYTEQGFNVPEDLKKWTLGKARQTAKFFMAWKSDKAAGQQTATRDDLIALLESVGAYAGEIPGVQTGVENLKSKPVDNPPADKTPEPPAEPVQTEEGAVKLLQEQLGAKVIGYDVSADSTCEACEGPVDDPDIAKLAITKFKKTLCVRDYKAAVQEARK